MNISIMDGAEIAVVSSGSSSRRNTLVSSIRDNHDNCYSTDTSLSSLSNDILEAVPQTKEDCYSPWTTSLEAATADLFSDSELWTFDRIADAISPQDGRILSSPNTPSNLSSVPMELIDPELQDVLFSSASSLPVITDSVEDTYGSIPTTTPERIESTGTQPLRGSQGMGGQLVAIDAEGGI